MNLVITATVNLLALNSFRAQICNAHQRMMNSLKDKNKNNDSLLINEDKSKQQISLTIVNVIIESITPSTTNIIITRKIIWTTTTTTTTTR